jgi:thiazole synthase ThiGH ThiG subunit
LGQEKFLLAGYRRQKVFEKIQGISLWYLQNTACTNFATEKVSVTRFARKVIDEEVGIRTIQ